MLQVIFPLVTGANGLIQYPDNISTFSGTDLHTSPGNIIAWYSGTFALPVNGMQAYTTPLPNYGTVMSLPSFMARFTAAEQQAIAGCGNVQGSLAILAGIGPAVGVDLTNSAVTALMDALVANNCITSSRSQTILTTPLTQGEAFTQ